jgi:hypothetical protein
VDLCAGDAMPQIAAEARHADRVCPEASLALDEIVVGPTPEHGV